MYNLNFQFHTLLLNLGGRWVKDRKMYHNMQSLLPKVRNNLSIYNIVTKQINQI